MMRLKVNWKIRESEKGRVGISKKVHALIGVMQSVYPAARLGLWEEDRENEAQWWDEDMEITKYVSKVCDEERVAVVWDCTGKRGGERAFVGVERIEGDDWRFLVKGKNLKAGKDFLERVASDPMKTG